MLVDGEKKVNFGSVIWSTGSFMIDKVLYSSLTRGERALHISTLMLREHRWWSVDKSTRYHQYSGQCGLGLENFEARVRWAGEPWWTQVRIGVNRELPGGGSYPCSQLPFDKPQWRQASARYSDDNLWWRHFTPNELWMAVISARIIHHHKLKAASAFAY